MQPPEVRSSGLSAALNTRMTERMQRAWRVWLQLSVPRSLLLSLCDQGVSVHRLPAFQLTCQATSTRCAPVTALAPATAPHPLPSSPHISPPDQRQVHTQYPDVPRCIVSS